MRDYAKAEPKMWHGKTFKALRQSPEGLIVALYLMTSPQSNMLGLFQQPILYMAHETGLGLEGASKGLARCISSGFCAYDHESEFVWVHEMARYQISSALKASDKQVKGVQREYDSLPENPFLGPFFDRYSESLLMTGKRCFQSPIQAPSKPLPSQEQEQEQEQEHEHEHEHEKKQPPATPEGFAEFWQTYPKKVGKPAALKAFRSAKLNGLLDIVLEDIREKSKSELWTKAGRQFAPNPSTYLNQRRWEDVIDPGKIMPTPVANKYTAAAAGIFGPAKPSQEIIDV